MTIKTFTFNPFQENTYIIHDETKEAVIIDAGCFSDAEKRVLKNYIEENKLKLKRVINTHLHIDHQFGTKFVFDTFLLENIVNQTRSFGLHLEEAAQALGGYIKDNQEIKVGNVTLTALSVPGHSPGGIAFYSKKEGVLFSGDVLFQGSIGRTDLPGGNYSTLIRSIKERILPLPDSTVVYTGHGTSTTIGEEKKNNPFL
jgi:glyoxylase-like metal-dependent hydrolase (beta-lactamase superfamily II)